MRLLQRRLASGAGKRGVTLIELVVAITILLILTSAALPIARTRIRRERERELRHGLWEMRDAIDRYKDAADRGLIAVEVDTEGYPPDLDTLVEGVALSGAPGRRLRFLRRIPLDPMTNSTEWGLRSVQDAPDSRYWNGKNVFDLHTRSTGTALDGTLYSDW